MVKRIAVNVFSYLKKTLTIKQVISHSDMKYYKTCPDCDGVGLEDMFIDCETCSGKGVIKKTWSEYCEA